MNGSNFQNLFKFLVVSEVSELSRELQDGGEEVLANLVQIRRGAMAKKLID